MLGVESFCPKGTLPPENPRVANTRKKDSVPIGIKGPFKKKKKVERLPSKTVTAS